MKKLILGASVLAVAGFISACSGLPEGTYTTMARSAFNVVDNRTGEDRTMSVPAASIRIGSDVFYLTNDQYIRGRTPTNDSIKVVVDNDIDIYDESEVYAYVRDLSGHKHKIHVKRKDCREVYEEPGLDCIIGTADDIFDRVCEW